MGLNRQQHTRNAICRVTLEPELGERVVSGQVSAAAPFWKG